jgi:hypothetical protein
MSSDKSGNLKVAGDGDVEVEVRRSNCDVDMAVQALEMRFWLFGEVDYDQSIESKIKQVHIQPFDMSFIVASLRWTDWRGV